MLSDVGKIKVDILINKYNNVSKAIRDRTSNNEKIIGFGLTVIAATFSIGLVQNINEIFLFVPIAIFWLVSYVVYLHTEVMILGGYAKQLEEKINTNAFLNVNFTLPFKPSTIPEEMLFLALNQFMIRGLCCRIIFAIFPIGLILEYMTFLVRQLTSSVKIFIISKRKSKMENKNLLKIYKYGDDILKLKAKEVENLDGKIVQLVDRMTRTMHQTYSAIGLAAPQVGESLRLSVIDLSMGENKGDQIVLINPEILETEGNETGDEGCLSFPGISLTINRAARIFLKNFDLSGKEICKECDGFLARVIQHEIDHLDGTLIIDRVSSLKRQFVKKEIKRLQKDEKW